MSASPTRKYREIAAKQKSPGPAAYNLNSTLGNGTCKTLRKDPAYSFSGRPQSCMIEDWRKPGPLYMSDPKLTSRGIKSAPSYSLRARTGGPREPATPAPAAYSPEKAKNGTHRTLPSYTMASKLAPLKPMTEIPAANTYSLASTLGSASKIYGGNVNPAYSMAAPLWHGSILDVPWRNTPGPSKYDKSNLSATLPRAPVYTMQSLAEPPRPGTKTPGPMSSTLPSKSAPAYSMGRRHSEYTYDNTSVGIAKMSSSLHCGDSSTFTQFGL